MVEAPSVCPIDEFPSASETLSCGTATGRPVSSAAVGTDACPRPRRPKRPALAAVARLAARPVRV